MPQQISQAIMDFALRCHEVPNLRTAVLFGSAAVGSLSKKSDIDVLLLFDTVSNPETGAEAEVVHGIAGEVSSKWSLSHPFSFVMYSRGETVEPSLLREVLRDGIVLFARTQDVLGAPRDRLRPHVLFSYTLRGMRPRDKMGLQRGLYGYTVVRRVGSKSYRSSSPGLVGLEGRRVGPTAFLVPNHKVEAARELLKGRGCAFKEVPVWTEGADTDRTAGPTG